MSFLPKQGRQKPTGIIHFYSLNCRYHKSQKVSAGTFPIEASVANKFRSLVNMSKCDFVRASVHFLNYLHRSFYHLSHINASDMVSSISIFIIIKEFRRRHWKFNRSLTNILSVVILQIERNRIKMFASSELLRERWTSGNSNIANSPIRSHCLNVFRTYGSIANKNTKVRSFKSSEYIRKKVDGPYFEVSAKKASSVSL